MKKPTYTQRNAESETFLTLQNIQAMKSHQRPGGDDSSRAKLAAYKPTLMTHLMRYPSRLPHITPQIHHLYCWGWHQSVTIMARVTAAEGRLVLSDCSWRKLCHVGDLCPNKIPSVQIKWTACCIFPASERAFYPTRRHHVRGEQQMLAIGRTDEQTQAVAAGRAITRLGTDHHSADFRHHRATAQRRRDGVWWSKTPNQALKNCRPRVCLGKRRVVMQGTGEQIAQRPGACDANALCPQPHHKRRRAVFLLPAAMKSCVYRT